MIDIEQVRTKEGETAIVFSSFKDTSAESKIAKTIIDRRNISSVEYTTMHLKREQVYNWIECDASDPEKEPNLVNQNKKPVKKQFVYINTKSGRYEQVRLNKYRMMEIIHKFYNSGNEKSKMVFSSIEPIKFFCDIETEVTHSTVAEMVEKASAKVLCISICDQFGNATVLSTYNMATTERSRLSQSVNDYFSVKLPHKKFNVTYEYYTSEESMLTHFFHVWMKKISFLSGWNFLKFDWAYLVRRAINRGLHPEVCGYPNQKFNNLSLRDKWDKKKKTIVPVPMHKAIVDYMMIYEKWDQSIKLKTNNGLEAVATELFGVAKQKYSGTLMDYYNRDPYGFIVYNIIDTVLVALIDEKLGTFKTMLSLTNEGLVSLNDSMFASSIVEMLSYGEYLAKGIVYTKPNASVDDVVVEKDESDDGSAPKQDSYKGGWVMEVTPGMFKNIVTVDFESLFPSIMSAFNTGLDTFIGKRIFLYKDIVTQKDWYVVPKGEYIEDVENAKGPYELLKDCTIVIRNKQNNDDLEIYGTNMYLDRTDGKIYEVSKTEHITTTYGAIYAKNVDSVMRLVVNKLLNKRVHNKNESGVVEIELIELKKRLKELKQA